MSSTNKIQNPKGVLQSGRAAGGLKSKNQKSEGISLLFMVLITGLILAVSLGISALLIQEMRMMGEIGYSVIAFYTADNGIEEAVYNLYQSPSPTPEHSGYLDSTYYHTWAKCCHFEFEKCSFGNPDNPEEERPICPLGIGNIGSNDPDDSDYCDAVNYCLKSLGSYKKVKRAIEIKY